MKMEVEMLSKELIKPSSPTPNHLRHLHISFLDQMVPHIWLPVLFFYSNKSNTNNLDICDQLKKSLSKVLTTYYPIAGRFKNSYIDCNDEGVLFVEAKSNSQLSDVIRERNPYYNNYFVPGRLDEHGDLVASIQITFFSCGGIVVSVSVSHKVGDALSWLTFIRRLAETTRGKTEIINIPPFGSATLFPPLDMSKFGIYYGELTKAKFATKLFVFDRSAIASLKDKYSRGHSGRRISSVLAVAGFICSRFMVTSQKNKNNKYRVMQGVNLRPRMNPPLPMSSFGNYAIAGPVVEGRVDDEDDDYWFEAVNKMADSTRNINADQITNMLQNEDGQANILHKLNIEKGVVSFVFTSLQALPLYEIDFGWGKPIWTGTAPCPGNNVVFLFATSDGLGLEAWVNFQEEDMAKFEIDDKLLRTVKLDPRSRL